MSNADYTLSFTVDQSPLAAFGCVTNARRWWSEEVVGESHQLGAVFYYHYQDAHRCTLQVTDLKPGRRVVWRVLHNDFSFIEDKSEWNGSELVFDIEDKDGATEVRFTHVGLHPDEQCYDICADAWKQYITKSLRNLIVTGRGEPNSTAAHPEHQAHVVEKVSQKQRSNGSENAGAT